MEKSDEIETKQEDEGNTEEVKKSENVTETKSEELYTKQEGEGNTDEVKKSENGTVPSLVCIIRCLLLKFAHFHLIFR